jgi:prevent-host-death family protein
MYITVYIDGMSQRYSIAQARSSLPTIVDQAEAGHQVELTRRGKPVAVVVSLREYERLRGGRAGFGEAYRVFLETHSLGEVGVDEDFAASVRDRSQGRKAAL